MTSAFFYKKKKIKYIQVFSSLLKCLGTNFIIVCSLKYFGLAFGNSSTSPDQCIFSSQLFLSQDTLSSYVPTDKTNTGVEPCFEHKKGSYYWNMLSENTATCDPHLFCSQRTTGLLFLR